VTASLPELPFKDGQFSLALVSHFLFLYSDQFDYDFRVTAFEELLRVADEVRVFPLFGLDRHRSPRVGPVINHLERVGFEVKVVSVEFAFQKVHDDTGNHMMRVFRRPA
jgi:hypothetical protein